MSKINTFLTGQVLFIEIKVTLCDINNIQLPHRTSSHYMSYVLISCLGDSCWAPLVPVIPNVFSLGAPVVAAACVPPLVPIARTVIWVTVITTTASQRHLLHNYTGAIHVYSVALGHFACSHYHTQFWPQLMLVHHRVPMDPLSCLLAFQRWLLWVGLQMWPPCLLLK